MSQLTSMHVRLPVWLRIFLVATAFTLAVLLTIASNLEPASQGFGTHQQLGFGECSFIVLWKIACPMCGMTTSWSHLMNGHLFQAFDASLGGTLLGLTSMIAVPVCLWRSTVGFSTSENWLSRFTLLWLCLVIFVIALQWSWRLWSGWPLG